MFKRKEVAIPEENALSKTVSLSRGDKLLSRSLAAAMALAPPGFGAIISYDSMMAQMLTNPAGVIGVLGGITIISSVGGFAVSKAGNSESLANGIAQTLDPNRTFGTVSRAHKKLKELQKSKIDRILLQSFHVKVTDELDIGEWQDKGNSAKEHSTHTINHYLVKEKGKFRVEQESIANDEAIWDLSADALVEVYKVNEKTDSMRGITS